MSVIYTCILLTLRLISIFTGMHKLGCAIIRDRYTSLKPINIIKYNVTFIGSASYARHQVRFGHFGEKFYLAWIYKVHCRIL